MARDHAELEAEAKITSAKDELIVLDWELPVDVRATDVTGDGVRNWSRSGSRVQIWLERGVHEVRLNLRGFARYHEGNEVRFLLPCLQFPGVPEQRTMVQILAGQGVVVGIESLDGLRALPPAPASRAGEVKSDGAATLGFSADRHPYGGVFKIRREVAAPVSPLSPRIESKDESAGAAAIINVKNDPPKLLLDQQAAIVLNGRSWLHQATYWLYYSVRQDLTVSLPPGSTLVRSVIDGVDVAAAETEHGKYWLPARGAHRKQTLTVSWTFSSHQESLEKPRMQRAHLDGVSVPPPGESLPLVWTLYLPSGYGLAHETARSVSSAELDLARARAQLTLSQLMIGNPAGKIEGVTKDALQRAQLDFYRYCGYVEYCLRISDKGADPAAAEQLAQLLATNNQLAEQWQFQELRAAAEYAARRVGPANRSEHPEAGQSTSKSWDVVGIFPSNGTAVYLAAESAKPIPQVRLVSVDAQRANQRIGVTGLLLVLALGAWMLNYYAGLVGWIMRLWPLALAGLASITWAILGPNWLSIVLGPLGLFLSSAYGAAWILGYFRRPRRALAEALAPVAPRP
jgi:hypothetical protein